MKPVILFESYPDFSGSPLEIYNELVKRGYDKKYDLVWAVYSTFNEKTNYKVVKFHGCNSQEKQQILARTKVIIDSNRYIYKPRPDVFRLHTRHGTNLKKALSYSRGIGPVDAMLSTSEAMIEIDKIVYPQQVASKSIPLGLPVNDLLFHHKDLYANGFMKSVTGTDKKFNKVFLWLPTYRQHRNNPSIGSKFIQPYGLPLFRNEDEAVKVNDELVKSNSVMLCQFHHAQAKNYKSLPKCSNMIFITEDMKRKFNITLADLLGFSDAMITDYSSVYYEFLLLNKPVALSVDDLVEYNRAVGFLYNYLEWLKGEYLINTSALIKFIADVSNGIDRLKDSRTEFRNKIYKFKDDKSTQRVVDFLIKYAKI